MIPARQKIKLCWQVQLSGIAMIVAPFLLVADSTLRTPLWLTVTFIGTIMLVVGGVIRQYIEEHINEEKEREEDFYL